nr:hypothetical protein CR513_13447 [Ipomoea batatas]GMD32517.1 hypothetical protein CR513_13447 [Ipomoea batatas]
MIINNSSSDGILMVRTESDQIAAPCASCNASGIIISIRVGLWASGLEDPRVGCGLAGVRAAKAPGAAIPRGVEGRAGALAGHHAPVVMRPHLQPHRANDSWAKAQSSGDKIIRSKNREEGDVPETKKKKMAERKRRDLNIASMIDVLRAWASRKVYSVTLLETLVGMGFL